MKATVDQRPDGESTIDALRRWLDEPLSAKPPENEPADLRKRMIVDEPAVAAESRRLLSRFEDIVRDGVARDLGDAPDSLRPKLVAAAAVAAMNAIEESGAAKAKSLGMIDQALVFLRAGVEALRPQDA